MGLGPTPLDVDAAQPGDEQAERFGRGHGKLAAPVHDPEEGALSFSAVEEVVVTVTAQFSAKIEWGTSVEYVAGDARELRDVRRCSSNEDLYEKGGQIGYERWVSGALHEEAKRRMRAFADAELLVSRDRGAS